MKPTPLSFSELQAQATKERERASSLFRDSVGRMFTETENLMVSRLLAFARAGGVEAIRNALDRLTVANERAEKDGKLPFRTSDLEASLAILNGTQP
jgi:hypothetical protein